MTSKPTTLSDLLDEEESILDRRNRERAAIWRAWNESPEGIASMERARQRQIEREALEPDEPEEIEEPDEDEEDEDEDE